MKNTRVRSKKEYVEFARKKYAAASNDAIEIDDNPKIAKSESGAWVAAWVWAGNADVVRTR